MEPSFKHNKPCTGIIQLLVDIFPDDCLNQLIPKQIQPGKKQLIMLTLLVLLVLWCNLGLPIFAKLSKYEWTILSLLRLSTFLLTWLLSLFSLSDWKCVKDWLWTVYLNQGSINGRIGKVHINLWYNSCDIISWLFYQPMWHLWSSII